jgi:hypothetical protein
MLKVCNGSGAEILTQSKSGLHYLRWRTSISAVKISQSAITGHRRDQTFGRASLPGSLLAGCPSKPQLGV